MEMGNHKFMLGHSGFLSGPTGPATALGSSATGGITPPEGGVAPWMKSDNYSAWGLFSEWNPGNWQFEGGVFEAHHRAVRNATAVNNMITNAGLLPDQLARYQAAPGGSVVYNIKTYYLRAGYSIFTKAEAEEYYNAHLADDYVFDFAFSRVGWQYVLSNGDVVDLEILEDTHPSIEFKSDTDEGVKKLLGMFAVSERDVIKGPSVTVFRQVVQPASLSS
jgi:hypothetical protein